VWGYVVLALAEGMQENEPWELSNPPCLADMPKNGRSFPKQSSQIQNFLVWIDHDWLKLGMVLVVAQLHE
jgi:hypothetical protein